MAVDINKLNQRYQALRTERSPWDTAWQSLADHFLPTKFRADTDSSERKPELLNKRLVDATGILDMRTLAAGLQGGMTSPVRPWFRLTLEDEDAAQAPDAGAWLDEVTRRMQALLHRSNFYNAVHGLYGDLGTFGVGCMMETADWSGLHFRTIPCGEYVIDTDDNGSVDTLMYRLRMSARQIVQRFGETVVPDAVKTAAANSGAGVTTFFDVIHAIFPRSERAYGKLGGSAMPWASVWWLGFGTVGGGKPCLLRESGYRDFPAFCPRWDVTGNDKYGRAPAMDVLPNVRMLQQMGGTILKGTHKAVDPPMVAPAGLRGAGVDLTPGGVNWMSTNGLETGKVEPVQQVQAQILVAAEQKVQAVQQSVHDGLFADLFKMLMLNDRRQITATEIDAREREKLILLGPVVERLDKELLSPAVMRTYSLMEQYDFLPPPPETVSGASLRVQFVSVLAQAQRLSQTSPIDQTLAFAANVAQADPTVLDILDTGVAMREYAEALGAPAAMLRSEQDVQQIRQARAQAQQEAQQQAQMQAAQQAAVDLSGAAKNLGQTPLGADGQTAMDAIIGGLGGM